jgi:hypothetical protein
MKRKGSFFLAAMVTAALCMCILGCTTYMHGLEDRAAAWKGADSPADVTPAHPGQQTYYTYKGHSLPLEQALRDSNGRPETVKNWRNKAIEWGEIYAPVDGEMVYMVGLKFQNLRFTTFAVKEAMRGRWNTPLDNCELRLW